MTEPTENTALEARPEMGLTAEQRADLLKRDGPSFITLLHGVSDAVMNNSPKGCRAGDFLLDGDKIIPGHNSGPGFRCKPLVDRSRAVYFKGKQVEMSSFRIGDENWNKIASLAAGWVQGAKIGFEFLLWMPDYDRYGILMVANQERATTGAKILDAIAKNKWIQITTTVKGGKNQVKFVVNDISTKDVEANVKLPSKEMTEKCLAAFEAYKTQKAAPAGPTR